MANQHLIIDTRLFMQSVSSIKQRWQQENTYAQEVWPIKLVGTLAFLAHVVFLAVFYQHNIMPMVWFNIFSVLFYAIGLSVLFKKKIYKPSVVLAATEILLHQLAAIYFIGWEFGFQFYLLAIPIFMLKIHWQTPIWPLFFTLAAIFAIIVMYFYSQNNAPIYTLPHLNASLTASLTALINLTVTAFLISLYAAIYYFMSQKRLSRIWQSQQDITQLFTLTTQDTLTGLATRFYSMEQLQKWHQEAFNFNQDLTIAMVDIDDFKIINDNYGHDIGDKALQHLARLMQTSIGENGLVARWGGEEFLIILPQQALENALKQLESMQAKITQTPFVSDQVHIELGITIGVTHCLKDDLTQMLKEADLALYQGKTKQKNCMVVYQQAAV